jgi:hypothetical protein
MRQLLRRFTAKTDAEVFTLAEGRVRIVYPAALSGESLKDLADYLDIFLRKAQRLSDDPHDFMPPKAPQTQAEALLQAEALQRNSP